MASLVGLALFDPPFEVGPAVGVGLAELADSGHVDGVVELSVPALGEAMHDPAARRELDRGCAVVGGVAVPAGEAADIAGVSDEHPGDDGRRRTVRVSGRGRCSHGVADPPVGALELVVEPANIVKQLDGQS